MKRFDKEFRLLFIAEPLLALDAWRLQRRRQDAEKGAARRSMAPPIARTSRGWRPTRCRAAIPVPRASARPIEYLEKEFLELGLQPLTGGDFRQDVALVEITGSDQKLSFNEGAGGMTLAMGDDMVHRLPAGPAGILDRGQRGRVRRLRHRCA